MEQGFTFHFCQNQLVLPVLFTLMQLVRFSTQNQGSQCYLFLCKMNFIRQLIKEQGCILKTFVRASVFFAVRFTSSRSSPPVRNVTHLRTFCFLKVIFAFGDILPISSCPFAARFTLRTALNSHEECKNLQTFCFKDHHYESFCLQRDSLSRAT